MSFLDRDPEMQELLGADQAAEPARIKVLPRAGDPSAIAGGAYDGASRFSRDLATWAPPIRSVNQDILEDKDTIDGRTRDTMRNDAFVSSGNSIRKDNIVGDMFLLNAKPAFKVLRLDEKWAEEFQEEVEEKFTLIAESPDNWLDASRQNTLTSLVRMVIGIHLMSGEVLASVEWMKKDGVRPCRTAIQMIDLDRLGNPSFQPPTKFLQGGVYRDRFGAPLGYWTRNAHPSEYMNADVFDWTFTRARLPWGRLQMIHIFEQFRPDQVRGISEMVSTLKELRVTKRFRDIVLQNAVVNATYAASIESDLPSEAVFAALGGGDVSEGNIAAAIQSYAGGYLSAINEYARTAKNLQLDGVKIPHLFPGSKLQLRPAGQGGPLGTEFEQSLLRYIAAGLGVSYEQLSRDYSQTNYSSVRAAMNETYKSMQALKRLVADRFATHVYRLWLEEAIGTGIITSMPRNAPAFWDGLNRDAYGQCSWIGASRGQIDELKETQAAVLRGKYNLSTDEAELGRLGQDWRQVYRQRAREKKMRDELGIEVQQGSDNMMNAATGAPRQKEAKDEKRDGSDNKAVTDPTDDLMQEVEPVDA